MNDDTTTTTYHSTTTTTATTTIKLDNTNNTSYELHLRVRVLGPTFVAVKRRVCTPFVGRANRMAAPHQVVMVDGTLSQPILGLENVRGPTSRAAPTFWQGLGRALKIACYISIAARLAMALWSWSWAAEKEPALPPATNMQPLALYDNSVLSNTSQHEMEAYYGWTVNITVPFVGDHWMLQDHGVDKRWCPAWDWKWALRSVVTLPDPADLRGGYVVVVGSVMAFLMRMIGSEVKNEVTKRCCKTNVGDLATGNDGRMVAGQNAQHSQVIWDKEWKEDAKKKILDMLGGLGKILGPQTTRIGVAMYGKNGQFLLQMTPKDTAHPWPAPIGAMWPAQNRVAYKVDNAAETMRNSVENDCDIDEQICEIFFPLTVDVQVNVHTLQKNTRCLSDVLKEHYTERVDSDFGHTDFPDKLAAIVFVGKLCNMHYLQVVAWNVTFYIYNGTLSCLGYYCCVVISIREFLYVFITTTCAYKFPGSPNSIYTN